MFDLYGDDEELQECCSSIKDDLFFPETECHPEVLAIPACIEWNSPVPEANTSDFDESCRGTLPTQLLIPLGARALLHQWVALHRHHLCLKSGDAAALAHLTGLMTEQVESFAESTFDQRRRPGKVFSASQEFEAKLRVQTESASSLLFSPSINGPPSVSMDNELLIMDSDANPPVPMSVDDHAVPADIFWCKHFRSTAVVESRSISA